VEEEEENERVYTIVCFCLLRKANVWPGSDFFYHHIEEDTHPIPARSSFSTCVTCLLHNFRRPATPAAHGRRIAAAAADRREHRCRCCRAFLTPFFLRFLVTIILFLVFLHTANDSGTGPPRWTCARADATDRMMTRRTSTSSRGRGRMRTISAAATATTTARRRQQ